MSVSFKIELEEEQLEKLFKLERVLRKRDFRKLLKEVSSLVKDQTQDRISDTKTGPDGKPWPDLKDATKRQRAKAGRRPDDILQFTGALKASIQSQSVSDFEIAIGSDLPYAAVHQEGSRDKTIPARPYLGLSISDEREILKEVDLFLKRLVK